MPPKKPKTTMSLNEFLGDTAYGSWADEMDDFPTAPSRTDEARGSALSRAPDRSERTAYPPRDELPLPTQPPYTAFVGNLPFDLTERELGAHFSGSEVKSAKIIKDREERPKGFGYVEFTTLDGLKAALDKTNTTLQNRSIRVSVAEPPKEREGGSRPFGDRGASGGFDDDRQWRRDGPLPPRDDGDRRASGFGGGFERRESAGPGSRSREERAPPPPSIAEETNDWRSAMRPSAPPPQPERERERGKFGGNRDFGDNTKRRGSGVNTPLDSPKPGPADIEEKWSIGSRLKPSQPSPDRASAHEDRGGGGFGRRSGIGKPPPEPDASDEVSDWRSTPRKLPVSSPGAGAGARGEGAAGRGPPPAEEKSPIDPPARRKLELLPRTNAPSGTPLGSPRSGEATPASATAPKLNPFGAAKPVDAAAREREITEKMERTRLSAQQNSSAFSGPSSRQGSRQGSRAGSPTRSPKPTALGLGGMNSDSGPPPKILSRGGGPPSRPGGYGGRGGHGGHGRTPSVTMSPKRGEGGGGGGGGFEGSWRRDTSSANTNTNTNNNNYNNPNPNSNSGTGPGSNSGPGSGIERRSSAVRPSFSFASAAGGSNKGSQSQSATNETKEEAIAAET